MTTPRPGLGKVKFAGFIGSSDDEKRFADARLQAAPSQSGQDFSIVPRAALGDDQPMADELQKVWAEALRLEAARAPHVLVQVLGARGSVPTEVGARLLYTPGSPVMGTVGGGKVEAAALTLAQELLAEKTSEQVRLVEKTWNLQRDIGMTCGGEIRLLWEVRHAQPWTAAIFGAGHVAQALIPVLIPLAIRLICVDERSEWLGRLPAAPNLRVVAQEDAAASVADLPPGTFVLSITQGHRMDLPVLTAALQREDLPFVGCIGSKAKAATLRKELQEAGLSKEKVNRLICPLGLPIGGNHPHEIALSIAAQLLQERDRLPP